MVMQLKFITKKEYPWTYEKDGEKITFLMRTLSREQRSEIEDLAYERASKDADGNVILQIKWNKIGDRLMAAACHGWELNDKFTTEKLLSIDDDNLRTEMVKHIREYNKIFTTSEEEEGNESETKSPDTLTETSEESKTKEASSTDG